MNHEWNMFAHFFIFVTVIQLSFGQILNVSDPKINTLSDGVSLVLINNTNSDKNISLSYTASKLGSILHLPNDVGNQFDTTQGLFSSNRVRAVRSTTVMKRTQCSISHNLVVLKNMTDMILLNVTGNDAKLKCQLNKQNTDTCGAFMESIQCGMNYVKNGFNNAISNRDSFDEIKKWKNAYDTLSDQYHTENDNDKQSLLQECHMKVNKLKTELQNSDISLNSAMDKWKETLPHICNEIIVGEIILGETSNAVTHFEKLTTVSISDIIQRASEYKSVRIDELKKFENIVKFIVLQPIIKNDVIAFTKLYQQLEKDDALNSSRIIILAHAVDKSPAKSQLLSLRRKIKIYAVEFVAIWSDVILYNRKNTAFDDLTNDFTKYFDEYLPKAVKKAVTDYAFADALDDRWENVLLYIGKLPFIPQAGYALTALMNYLKENNKLDNAKLMKTAYYIKEYMTMENYPNLVRDEKKLFEDLKDNLPSKVRDVVWNGNRCTMFNHEWQQYLYTDIDNDNDQRRVFSWRNEVPCEGIPGSQWTFEIDDDGSTFIIKNVLWEEYLFAANYSDDHRRSIFTWIPGDSPSSGKWKMTPRHNAKYFTLQNTHYNDEYLYIDGNYVWDASRRRPFTWGLGKPQNVMIKESEWDISCN